MKNSQKLFIGIVLLLFSFPLLHAQDSDWQIITHAGDTVKGCRLDSLHDNVLSAMCDHGAVSISVDSIAILMRTNSGGFSRGVMIGSLTGLAVGAGIGAATYEKPKPRDFGTWDLDLGGPGVNALGGAFFGTLGGFIIGGVVGSLTSGSESFDLQGTTPEMKQQIITRLLSE